MAVKPRFVRPRDAAEYVGLHRTTLYSYAHRGLFPKPIQIGPRKVAFRLADLEAWCDAREKAAGLETPEAGD